MSKAGATPKEIQSDRESKFIPNSDSVFDILAKYPSNPSATTAAIINRAAINSLLLRIKTMATNPREIFKIVKISAFFK